MHGLCSDTKCGGCEGCLHRAALVRIVRLKEMLRCAEALVEQVAPKFADEMRKVRRADEPATCQIMYDPPTVCGAILEDSTGTIIACQKAYQHKDRCIDE